MITEDRIHTRNKELEKLFIKNFPGYNVKVIGNINYPSVVLDDATVLSCYVHNFWLIFTDKPFKGEEVFRHKLGTRRPVNKKKLANWYLDSEHRAAYTVGVKNTPLKLTGFHYTKNDDDTVNEKYPIFSDRGYTIYFNKNKVEEIVETSEELELEIL